MLQVASAAAHAAWRRKELMSQIRRRDLVGGALMAVAPAAVLAEPRDNLAVAAMFAGSIRDGGFMQAGYEGLIAARDRLGVRIRVRAGVAPGPEALAAALRDLAASGPGLILAHGGQNDGPAAIVAGEFPALAFAVTQGAVAGPNLASYAVAQEQSAFLAGALAGLTTRTGIVAHLSGIRVTPGLKGRAAYAAGLRLANPAARLLTGFCGDQDDPALARRWALAMIDAGADVLFTMLNAGIPGASDACRSRHRAQIGNVADWTVRDPGVFIGSAVANAGAAVFAAVKDAARGSLRPGRIHVIGLESPADVRLALRSDVPVVIRHRLAALSADILAGRLSIPTGWTGQEFAPPV